MIIKVLNKTTRRPSRVWAGGSWGFYGGRERVSENTIAIFCTESTLETVFFRVFYQKHREKLAQNVGGKAEKTIF